MGFALWIDRGGRVAWARGTHEYRPMGAAVVAVTDRFRARDFSPARRLPREADGSFAGFYGSLEEVNRAVVGWRAIRLRPTPIHLR